MLKVQGSVRFHVVEVHRSVIEDLQDLKAIFRGRVCRVVVHLVGDTAHFKWCCGVGWWCESVVNRGDDVCFWYFGIIVRLEIGKIDSQETDELCALLDREWMDHCCQYTQEQQSSARCFTVWAWWSTDWDLRNVILEIQPCQECGRTEYNQSWIKSLARLDKVEVLCVSYVLNTNPDSGLNEFRVYRRIELAS